MVEVVLDGALAATGDEDEVLDPCRPRLGHHIGEHRPVDDVEQLLGHRLGAGQHAGAQASDRQNGFTDGLHAASSPGCAGLLVDAAPVG